MERTCKFCGCTDNDCSQCIKKTGQPCYWVSADVCSACALEDRSPVADPDEKNRVYGLQSNDTPGKFIVYTGIEELLETITADIATADPGTAFDYKIKIEIMTNQELENLPETEI
jgi:hypothetical protein